MNSDKFKRQIESMWKYRDTDEQKRLVKFTIAKTMRLALEYPELAQEYFDSLCKVIPDNERITVSNYQHNLTSDAVGEETLICEKSKVQRAYNTSREIVKDENPDTLMYSMHTQIMCVLESIFGTKCLPDEDIHEDNFTSIEPKPAEPKEGADKQFDNILKDSFQNKRRLNIAAQIVASMIGSDDWTTWRGGSNKEIWHNMAKSSLEIADALIAECKEGGGNA